MVYCASRFFINLVDVIVVILVGAMLNFRVESMKMCIFFG